MTMRFMSIDLGPDRELNRRLEPACVVEGLRPTPGLMNPMTWHLACTEGVGRKA